MNRTDLEAALNELAARRAVKGFTFDDLVKVAAFKDVTIGAVADWLANARSSGLVAELGFDSGAGSGMLGPRRYRLATARPEADADASQRAM